MFPSGIAAGPQGCPALIVPRHVSCSLYPDLVYDAGDLQTDLVADVDGPPDYGNVTREPIFPEWFGSIGLYGPFNILASLR